LLRELRQGRLRPGLLALLAVAALSCAPALAAGSGGTLRVEGREVVPADVVLVRPAEAAVPGTAKVAAVRGSDRWAREIAVVMDGDGAPLAEQWLAQGMAAVDPDAAGENAARLLQLEAGARAAGRGIWAEPRWRVQDAAQVRGAAGDLVIVAGRVHAVGWAGDRLYLNFGEDRRSDFTARAERADVRAMAKAGIQLEALAGREVRLRGWLFQLGGPMIELAGPAQIEVLP